MQNMKMIAFVGLTMSLLNAHAAEGSLEMKRRTEFFLLEASGAAKMFLGSVSLDKGADDRERFLVKACQQLEDADKLAHRIGPEERYFVRELKKSILQIILAREYAQGPCFPLKLMPPSEVADESFQIWR